MCCLSVFERVVLHVEVDDKSTRTPQLFVTVHTIYIFLQELFFEWTIMVSLRYFTHGTLLSVWWAMSEHFKEQYYCMKEGSYKIIQNKLWHHSNRIKLILIVASKQHSLYTSLWEEKPKTHSSDASNVLWLFAIHMPPAVLTITVANFNYDLTQRHYCALRN